MIQCPFCQHLQRARASQVKRDERMLAELRKIFELLKRLQTRSPRTKSESQQAWEWRQQAAELEALEFLALLDRSGVVFSHAGGDLFATESAGNSWKGSARDLRRLLTGHGSNLTESERQRAGEQMLGKKLANLRRCFPAIARFARHSRGRVWTLQRLSESEK